MIEINGHIDLFISIRSNSHLNLNFFQSPYTFTYLMELKSSMFFWHNLNLLTINFLVVRIQSIFLFTDNPVWFFWFSAFLINVSISYFKTYGNLIISRHLHLWNNAVLIRTDSNECEFILTDFRVSRKIYLLEKLTFSIINLDFNAERDSFKLGCFI